MQQNIFSLVVVFTAALIHHPLMFFCFSAKDILTLQTEVEHFRQLLLNARTITDSRLKGELPHSRMKLDLLMFIKSKVTLVLI